MRFFSIIAATTLLSLSFSNALDTPTAADMATLTSRRIDSIKDRGATSASNLNLWKTTIKDDGTWDSVDYLAGCGSRISNWPATVHLSRTISLAGAYISNTEDQALLDAAMAALNYWLANDFEPSDCIADGGVEGLNCPCGTPGLWSKNWYNQVISVPSRIGDICLLLKDLLNPGQRAACTKIQARAFTKFFAEVSVQSISSVTGANLLDVASVGITLGLLDDDPARLKQALEAFYGGVFINPVTAGDGIQSDGSFMQHNGILYNGNYGVEFFNELLNVFIETKETALAPPDDAQNAFATLMSGSEWMIMADAKLNKLLWQYSVIGRMISFRLSDKQASGGVFIDLNKVNEGTEGWAIEDKVDAITDRLKAPHNVDANQGDLIGTRYFYNSDYMVHRTPDYITTMKMYSSRTINSECLNVQNPYGFHLSDGAIYNYITGDEYADTFVNWNWELVPGITVDIEGTPLKCSTVKKKGIKPFVGGVTEGNTGIAVMDYQNPTNAKLSFKKTAFFFPSGYAVQVGPVTSKNTTAQLATVLDQRKRNGDIYVSGELKNTDTNYNTVKTNSIWHDKIGYYFPNSEVLNVDSTPTTADWSDIGISTGSVTQQLWTSYIKHSQLSTTGLLTQYVVQPNIAQSTFQDSITNGTIPITLAFQASSPQVHAAYSAADDTIGVAFWTAGTYATPWKSATITTDQPCIALLRQTASDTYRLILSDPSQTLTTIKIKLKVNTVTKSLTYTLPTGSSAGKGQSKTIVF